ncbi:hypothetical protein M728_002885 [Ensifer sp. WSM1721]
MISGPWEPWIKTVIVQTNENGCERTAPFLTPLFFR